MTLASHEVTCYPGSAILAQSEIVRRKVVGFCRPRSFGRRFGLFRGDAAVANDLGDDEAGAGRSGVARLRPVNKRRAI